MNHQCGRSGSWSLVALVTTRLAPVGLILLVLAVPALGQDRIVLRGTVLNSGTREPLGGAQVLAPLSEISAVTDSLGEFRIPFVQDSHYELVAAAMGYQPARFTVGSDAEQGSIAIALAPDPEAMASLAVLHDGLEERRRRHRTRRLRVIDNVELGRSDASTAYSLVRDLAVAQPCEALQELCRLGRRVRLCVDDMSPIGGARELEAYLPSDLWLIEVYREGREVRVYSRWFIDQIIRTRHGEVRRTPMC